jgi:5-methylcytosine-specific restriction protein A
VRGASRCPAHVRREENRANAHQRGYDRNWARVRKHKLSIDPLCEDCLDEGTTTAASQVHHVLKVCDRPDLRLDLENLRALCASCHSRRTARGE